MSSGLGVACRERESAIGTVGGPPKMAGPLSAIEVGTVAALAATASSLLV